MPHLLLLVLTLQTVPESQPVPSFVENGELHVSVSGAGEPILLIPGLLGAGFAYRGVIPLLHGIGYRTVVVDLLGTGGSAQTQDADYSLESQAHRIAVILDTLGVSGAGVVAHAIGGSIALRLALRRPDLVSTILLLEGGPAESIATPGLRKTMKLKKLIRLFGAGSVRGRIRDQMIQNSGNPAWVDSTSVRGYTAAASQDLGATLDALAAMARSKEPDSLAYRLGAIEQPVHLLLGGMPHDGGPSSSEIDRLANALPRFSADTIPGVGHFIHEEVPELVRDALRRMRGGRVAVARDSRSE